MPHFALLAWPQLRDVLFGVERELQQRGQQLAHMRSIKANKAQRVWQDAQVDGGLG